MVDGVADQVDHRVAQPLDDRAVEPGFLADDPQLDLLARAVGQVADHAGEPREELIDRDHPQVERRVPDLPADPLERLERVHPGCDARRSRAGPGGCRRARPARRPARPGRRAGRRRPGSGRAAAAAGNGESRARVRCPGAMAGRLPRAPPAVGRRRQSRVGRRRPRASSGPRSTAGSGLGAQAIGRRSAMPRLLRRRRPAAPARACRRPAAARSCTVLSSATNRKTSRSRSGSASVLTVIVQLR